MLHKDILTISFRHRYQISKTFNELLGINGIDHFSLDLVRPDSEMVFFSGTPSHGYEICKQGYGSYDGIISPEYYENFEFYWWKDAYHKAYADKIAAIREGVLGLKHGFMLVRKWNDFYLIYSFATKSDDPHFQSVVINNINQFLRMGDYAYTEMREIYTDYCNRYEPPVIEKFYSFEGGEPPARYTKSYKLNRNGILMPENPDNLMLQTNLSNIIQLDFKYKTKLS